MVIIQQIWRFFGDYTKFSGLFNTFIGFHAFKVILNITVVGLRLLYTKFRNGRLTCKNNDRVTCTTILLLSGGC